MPWRDGTGPMGLGPMTGRGMGFCAVNIPGNMNTIPFRRVGFFGRGVGHGYRNWFYATGLTRWQRAMAGYPVARGFANMPFFGAPTPEQEVDMLKRQSEFYSNALSDIEKRLKELENEKAEVK